MPRIDPLQLLRCLSVLLSPTGGIKSTAEVQRLASLMTKFSKKLVSKCIYIQILKQTQTDLLKMFMTLGGWNLIHTWLSDAVIAKNWPLIEQLLELLLMCPVDVELLKTNSCPKLVKGLSKESTNDCVKQLACKLVEQWLRMVKGETAGVAAPVSVAQSPPRQAAESVPQAVAAPAPAEVVAEPAAEVSEPPVPVPVPAAEESLPVAQDTLSPAEDGKQVVEVKCETPCDENIVAPSLVECTDDVEDSKESGQHSVTMVETPKQEVDIDSVGGDVKKEEAATSEDSGEDAAASEGPVGQLPVYKITIRDGKQVLAKVHSGDKPQKSVVTTAVVDVEEEVQLVKQEVKQNAVVSLKKLDLSADLEQSIQKKKSEQAKGARIQKSTGKIDRSESISSDDSVKPSKNSRKKSKEQKKLEKNNDEKPKTKEAPKAKATNLKTKLKNKKEKVEEKLKLKSKEKKKEKEKEIEKERNEQKYNSGSDLDEKDKALLAKLIPPAISKLGKIPKKKRPEEPEKIDVKKSEEVKKVPEKRLPPPPPSEPKKTASMSIEVRKPSSAPRPKTVKTYHSKFRSTGLEEELKPPVPRAAVVVKKPPAPVPLLEKKPPVKPPLPVKRPSPTRDVPAEKKLKIDINPEKEKVGGAKLIPPRPKPAFLQESDMFMDALTASSKKEPRKRKRRASNSGKDGPDARKYTAMKEDDENKDTTPPASPSGESPSSIKPSFKFYQDTLEVEEDDKDVEMKESKGDQEGSDSGESDDNNKCQESIDVDESQEGAVGDAGRDDTVTSTSELEGNTVANTFKGVLVYHKVKGPKKSVRWKPEKELIEVQYFELDETERVNVTKTFTDMKQMERTHEREAFLLARKVSQDDTMEEKIQWRPLIPIDLPPSVVESGMNSREKDVQYAREKVVLRALYFNKSSIPDSPAEPDLEIHATTDPVVIPLEDASGVQESVNDFTGTPWPDPKPLLPPSPPHVMQYHKPQQVMGAPQGMGPHHPGPLLPQPVMSPPHQPQPPPQQFQPYMQQQYPMQQGMMYPAQGMPMMGPMPGPAPPMMGGMTGPMPLMQQHPTMQQPGGDWRTGDGKVVTMNEMPMEMYNQGGPGPGPSMPMGMGMGGMPGPDMNYSMMGGEMGGYPQQGFPMGGAPPMFQPQPPPPPQQQQQQQFPPRGNPGRRNMRGGRRGNWGGGGNWQGNRGRGGNWSGGGSNSRPSVCKHFRSGYCRTGDDCPFLHPGVNGPQY